MASFTEPSLPRQFFSLRGRVACIGFAVLLAVIGLQAQAWAAFHVMQVEQVLSLNGNPGAQAIQLRLRSAGQNLVANSKLWAWNATGTGRVLVLDIASNASNSASGARILFATSAFTSAMIGAGVTTFTPDFTLANAIPAGYLAAGRLTFEDDGGSVATAGTIYWSVSWGGAAYTGSNTGSTQNDADGNFGPPYALGLPTTGAHGIRFTGTSSAPSTTNAANYALASNPATVTKNNGTAFTIPSQLTVPDPGSTVSVAITAPGTVAEDAANGNFLTYTFTRTDVITSAITVNFTASGSATKDTDYGVSGASFSGLAGTVTFAANVTTATVLVDPIADATGEPDETVIFTIDNGTGYTAAASPNNMATGTILNDDSAVSVAVTGSPILENASVGTVLTYTFTRSGGNAAPLTINFSAGGSASFANDYSISGADSYSTASGLGTLTFASGSSTKAITLAPTNDMLAEGDETAVISVSTGSGYGVGTSPAVGTISDNETVTLTLSPPETPAAEGGSLVAGVLTLTLASSDLGTVTLMTDVEVEFTDARTGTAQDGGNDYTFADPTTVTFAAGSPSGATRTASFTAIVDDQLVEGTETAYLGAHVQSGPAMFSGDHTIHTITTSINDNDTATVALSAPAVTASEGGGTGAALLTLTLNTSGIGPQQLDQAITVNLTDLGTGTATAGAANDYTFTGPTVVTFAAGSPTAATQTASFASVVNDQLVEGTETVNLSAAIGSGPAAISGSNLITASINDNNVPTLGITATDADADENTGGTGSWRITRDTTLGSTTVQLLINASSTAGTVDWTQTGTTFSSLAPGSTGTAFIATGQTFVDITLTPINDLHAEAAETVILNITADASYTTASPNNATVTIGANDFVVINSNDSGEGSLRQALANAAANPGPDTITLTSTQTLTLSSELLINDPAGVTIDASGLSSGFTLTDNGNVNHRLLHVASGSTLTVRDVTFANGGGANFTDSGGAILNEGGLMLERCRLSGSAVTQGGAIFNFGTMTLTQCTLSGSSATQGGAISNYGTLTLTQCTLFDNSATGAGGAINNDTACALTLTQCTFSGNSASNGGAIFNAGMLTLTHCTLSGNFAPNGGGAIYTTNSIVLTNSIVAGNTLSGAGSGADIFHYGDLSRVGVNIIQSIFFNDISGTDTGPAPVNAAPLLAPLGNYGGPTQTMPPLPGSPAMDQASVLSPPLTIDQRGQPRPLGIRPDIGAVEGSVIIVTTPVDELDAPGTLGAGVSLREAIRDITAGGTIVFDRAVFNSTSTNTITLTKGPLNPQQNCTLNGTLNPGGITIQHTLTITQQPVPLAVADDDLASFAVTVTNLSGGLAYQWRKDGSDLAGRTAATYTILNVQEGDEAVYDVTITEAASPGTLTLDNVNLTPASGRSQPASLVVNGSPVTVKRITGAGMIALGSSHTLSVVAIGPATPALTYQWMKNGVKVAGATKTSLTFAKVALANAGAYTCVVKSGTTPATSTTAEVGVVDTTAKTVSLKVGGKFIATVNAAGTGTLAYLWSNGQMTKSCTINTVAVGDAGLYTCTVTGLAGFFTGGAPTSLNVSNAAPQLAALALPAATIGQAYFYQVPVVSVAGAPATGFTLTGVLPTGIVFNKVTGVFSGRPTVSKPAGYPLTLKATNAFTSSAPATATLMVNVVPPTAIGTFAGPVMRSPLNDNLGGRFDLTTTATGTFSGSVQLGARKLAFKSQLLLSAGTGDIILRGNIAGITMADKTPLTAYIEIFAVDQTTVLTLVHPDGRTLLGTAWRNPWFISKTPALNQPATAYATRYSLRLDAGIAASSPQGYGYASFTIAPNGTLTLAGKLPDGSAVSGGTHVGPNGEVLVFNLLYGNRGTHVGQWSIAKATPVTDNVIAGTTSWLKPAPLATSTDTVYQAGFGLLTVIAAGSSYVAPTAGQLVMGLGAVVSPVTNAKLSFTLGGLDVEGNEFSQMLRIDNLKPTSLTNTFFIAPYNAAFMPNPNPNRVAMSVLTASTGLFSGSFTMAGAATALNRPAPYFGQIVKIGATTQGCGYFLLPTATAKIATSPKLSGRVVLGVP